MKSTYLILLLCLATISCKDQTKKENTDINPIDDRSTELKKSMERGKIVYSNFCITCHMANGKGFGKTFPPLAKSDYLMTKRTESIKAIKYGLSEEIIVNGITYTTPMAKLGLSDEEIADVMNYITNSWGNKNPSIITEKEVSKIKPKLSINN